VWRDPDLQGVPARRSLPSPLSDLALSVSLPVEKRPQCGQAIVDDAPELVKVQAARHSEEGRKIAPRVQKNWPYFPYWPICQAELSGLPLESGQFTFRTIS
jgi:hypothetical protein